MKFIGMFFLIIITCLAAVLAAAESPRDIVQAYVDAQIAADYTAAASFWDDRALDRSAQLGITFAGVPAKYDCASPVMLYLDGLQNGQVKARITQEKIDGDIGRVEVALSNDDTEVTYWYYVAKRDGAWKISSPLFLYTDGWVKQETKYTRIIHDPGRFVHPRAARAIDRFIEETCRTLGVPDDRMAQLREKKIDYYYCNQDEFRELTGFDAHGLGILQFDAIVSRHLPHDHELVHVLVNYALETPRLFTVPFLQEGLACMLGGRWERSPRVIDYSGFVSLNYDLCAPDDVLTFDDFHKTIGSPDITYPVSSLLCRYLIHIGGMDNFKRLYSRLSGSQFDIRGFDRETIQYTISEVFNRPWSEIQSGFGTFWPRYESVGMNPGSPCTTEKLISETTGDDITARLYECGENTVFQITLPEATASGVLAFVDSHGSAVHGFRSKLFSTHVPESNDPQPDYGIKFSAAEAGLYDYVCDELLVNFVPALSTKSGYWDEAGKTITFEIARDVMRPENPEKYRIELIRTDK